MRRDRIISLIWLIFIFILANSMVYELTEINKKQRVKIALEDNLNDLKTHFEILLHNQKITADAAYISTVTMMPGFIELFAKISKASNKEKVIMRTKLFNMLKKKYDILKTKGILQYHFVLPNNESFLRMHKPNKFGDDLTKIREDLRYVNNIKRPLRGFVQGRTSHAFRNTYPIFDSNGKHLGAMEASFSSDSIQEYLTNISGIHTHFIVNKDIFDVKIWKRDDLILKYLQSAEHKDFMLTMNKAHTKQKCIIDNKHKLKSVQSDINIGIQKGEKFALYVVHKHGDAHVDVISFYPIKSLTKTKTLAWLVSYEGSDFIYTTLKGGILIRTVAFFIFLLLLYFMYRTLNQKEILNDIVKEKTTELEEINENLEQRILFEVGKNKQQQQQIFESSKMAQMGEMIGNIAHQWRQPLSVISTSATGMIMQKEYGVITDETFKKSCESINDHAQFLSETINTFSNFIKEKKERKEIVLQEDISKTIDIISPTLKNNQIELKNNINHIKSIKLTIIAGELSQVIINIINNAKDVLLDKQIENPWIQLDIDKTTDKVVVTIEDNAGGIPEEILSKIFDPYFTTKHQSQGTGLGLHMSQQIVHDSLKGKLYVKNSSQGAKFFIELPLN